MKDNKHPQGQMFMAFMETLNDLGGKADTKKFYDAYAERTEVSENERKETIESKGCKYSKWERAVRWIKESLKVKKYVNTPERGVWELTEEGKEFLELMNIKSGQAVEVYRVVDDRNETQGVALWAEAQEADKILEDESVNCIITSPPYALSTPKEYGNVNGSEYVEWFKPIAEIMKRKLTKDGSLFINLGSSYVEGMPVKDLYIHKVILMMCEELGFYLCQEFFWHSPSKLPTGHWVTNTRERTKDTTEYVLWFSKCPHPYADNRNVLEVYSEKYKKLLKEGGYKPSERPSGHRIDHFNKDNGGKIPSNLMTFSNAVSSSQYFKYCKDKGIKPHPARFPIEIPRFLIKLASKVNDVIWDPFSGSLTVMEAAIELGRKCVATEKSLLYILGSIGRFAHEKVQIQEPFDVIIEGV